jgi:hypothetical protein
VEQDGDNGAAWFIGPGPWFERIKHDERSMRDATRRFWFQTRNMDKYIGGRPKSADFAVPTFSLMVRGDRLMDNEKMEKHIRDHAPDGIFKYYAGGPGAYHLLFFTADAEETVADVRHFLECRRDRIENLETPEGR